MQCPIIKHVKEKGKSFRDMLEVFFSLLFFLFKLAALINLKIKNNCLWIEIPMSLLVFCKTCFFSSKTSFSDNALENGNKWTSLIKEYLGSGDWGVGGLHRKSKVGLTSKQFYSRHLRYPWMCTESFILMAPSLCAVAWLKERALIHMEYDLIRWPLS